MAGRTRKDIEQQSGKPVISTENFKQLARIKVERATVAAKPLKKKSGRETP